MAWNEGLGACGFVLPSVVTSPAPAGNGLGAMRAQPALEVSSLHCSGLQDQRFDAYVAGSGKRVAVSSAPLDCGHQSLRDVLLRLFGAAALADRLRDLGHLGAEPPVLTLGEYHRVGRLRRIGHVHHGTPPVPRSSPRPRRSGEVAQRPRRLSSKEKGASCSPRMGRSARLFARKGSPRSATGSGSPVRRAGGKSPRARRTSGSTRKIATISDE